MKFTCTCTGQFCIEHLWVVKVSFRPNFGCYSGRHLDDFMFVEWNGICVFFLDAGGVII